LERDQLERSRQEPLNGKNFSQARTRRLKDRRGFCWKITLPSPVLRTPSFRPAGRGTGRGALSFDSVTVEDSYPYYNHANLCSLGKELAAREHSAARPQPKECRHSCRHFPFAPAFRAIHGRTRMSALLKILAAHYDSDVLQYKEHKERVLWFAFFAFFYGSYLWWRRKPR
jgi:hypothetical protein